MGFLEGVMNTRDSQTQCRVHPPSQKGDNVTYVGSIQSSKSKHQVKCSSYSNTNKNSNDLFQYECGWSNIEFFSSLGILH